MYDWTQEQLNIFEAVASKVEGGNLLHEFIKISAVAG